ncbi:sensor histidine kinase [Parvularcula marina]|uniref:sensor histidine kinase n=1 Tax=Parvularcula marina TaxID=2292771 RepID=UPI0035114086
MTERTLTTEPAPENPAGPHRQDVAESEVRLRAILDHALDGVITISEEGTIESLNPAALNLFGYDDHEMIGANVKMLMPDPFQDHHDQYLKHYRDTGEKKIIGIGREVVGQRKDGSKFPADLSISEFRLGERRLFTGIVRDISERKEAEEKRDLLIAELSHRVKNTLATVISVAQRSFHEDASYAAGRKSFEGRIRGLAHTHNRLAESKWTGADLRSTVEDELSPYRNDKAENLSLHGPDINLTPKGAITLGMAFHELATNAAKYGALSVDEGKVTVSWDVSDDNELLAIQWAESGGPAVEPPTRRGFGHMLLERGVPYDLHGTVELNFYPDGVTCNIAVPTDVSVMHPE